MAVGSITSLIIIPSSSARFLNHINNHHGQFSSSSLLRVQGPLQKQLQGFRVIPLPYYHNHYPHHHQPHGISYINGTKLTDTDNTPSVFASAASSSSTVSSIGSETGSGLSLEVREIKERYKKWQWRGHTINYLVHCTDEDRPPLLLVHGFGASVAHWRRNILTLTQSYTVYAIDLLGFGASDKPLGFPYTMEVWAQLILDFLDEIIQKPTVLIGNSIGSLACVIAASESSHSLVRALVLLNCAGGMNNKAIVDDWRIKLLLPLLWLIDFLLNQKGIASFIFERVTRRENLKNILLSVYGNKDFVDDDLVEIIREPAQGEEALDAFVSIVTGPPGPSPVQLMPRINLPVLVLWGDQDTLTPLDGPVGKYFSSLPAQLPNISLFILEGVGHCPHDDRPDLVHEKLLPWLDLLPAL
ncbi:unnamed protein product [Camellia sinensis]